MSLALLVLRQLVALAGLALAAGGLGALLTARRTAASRAERIALATALGLGAAGSLLFAAGLVGGLRRSVVLILAAGAGAAAVASWRAGRFRAAPVERRNAGAGSWRFAPALGIGAILVPAFVWGLYPPYAFDETAYHLPFARAFVEAHRLVETPDLAFNMFPQLAETLFAALMVATGGDTATHAVQWLAVAATALLLYGAGRRFYSPRAGVWAAALWLAHPLVHYQAASAYVDATLALFALAAVYAWELWRERDEWAWLALAAAAAGFGAATKYHGLLWLSLLLALTLVAARPGRRLRGAALLVAIACLVAGPWYLRIYRATGNPVHPFLAPMFGSEPPSQVDRQLGLDDETAAADLPRLAARRLARAARRPAELARFAWKASFDPPAFDRQAPLAPWPLLLTPLAAAFAWRDRRLLRWLVLVFLYAVFWTTTQPRFQLPGAALLALAGAAGLEHTAAAHGSVGRWLGRRGAALLLAALLVAPGPLYATYKLVALGQAPPTTPSARDDFLDRRIPAHAAVRLLNETRGSDYTLFAAWAPELAYCARGRLLGQWRGPHSISRVAPLLGDAAALHRELRSMGVDHLLVVGAARDALARDASFPLFFTGLFRDEVCELYRLEPAAAGGAGSEAE